MAGGSAKKQVVGHRYFRTMHMGVCHGAVDALRAIWVKDKVAWSGDLRRGTSGASKTGYINQTGLFGGDDSEGGVKGYFEVGFGGLDQVLLGVNSDGTTDVAPIKALGVEKPNQPVMGVNYRGIMMVNFFDFYWGSSPYISDIAFEVERYWDDWFPELAKIGIDANPAHIIYECITSDQWGLGYSADQIDDNAFRVAAGVLTNEGLGLSMAWSEQQAIEEFIGGILDQIDGAFYFSPRTGKWTLSLVREGDPVVHKLDPDNCKLTNFSRRVLGETVNELTVQWVNPETEEFQAVTVQDDANISATGQTIPGSKNYPGVRSEALAGRLAVRDLAEISATLAACEIIADREAWFLEPGNVVEFSWPPHGIVSLRMRVTSFNQTQDTSDIRLTLVEDVFGQSLGSFVGTNPPGWVDVRKYATQFNVLAPFEIPYWFVYQASEGQTPGVDFTYGSVLPVSDNTNVLSTSLFALTSTPSSSSYELMDTANVTPSGLLSTALVKEFYSTATVLSTSLTSAEIIEIDSFVVIGSGSGAEIARVIGVFAAGGFTLQRGLMDTHPKAWPTGTRIYLIGQAQFPADPTSRSLGETVNYKVTMQTSLSATNIEDVPVSPLTLRGRQGRPYSVANVKINGSYWPDRVDAGNSLVITWSTRNRLLQNGQVQVGWNESNVTAEAGTQILVFATQGGVVVASTLITNPATTTATLDFTGVPGGVTVISVRTMRGGWDNYQDFNHTITLNASAGWGMSWGY